MTKICDAMIRLGTTLKFLLNSHFPRGKHATIKIPYQGLNFKLAI